MAKCTKCESRKGKRKCLATDTFICSLCCGEYRTEEKCQGCSYYKEPKLNRNYKSAPHFSLSMMSILDNLQDQANVLESAFCRLDEDLKNNFNDNDASIFSNASAMKTPPTTLSKLRGAMRSRSPGALVRMYPFFAAAITVGQTDSIRWMSS